MIEKFIKYISDVLQIDTPSISYDESNFPTVSMRGYYNPGLKTIFLRKVKEITPDFLFAIAHEMRHIWQIENDESLFFADYKPIEFSKSLTDYNLQLAEIDANAFAALLMTINFEIKPLFKGLPDIVKSKINERIIYLQKNEFKEFPRF